MGLQVVYISLLVLVFYRTKACDITKECSKAKDVKWATDGTTCHVFENKCYLDKENCHYKNKKVAELQEVSQETCQRLCVTECEDDNNPVCGYYSEEKVTFANQCEMESHICRTGKTLFIFEIGPCD